MRNTLEKRLARLEQVMMPKLPRQLVINRMIAIRQAEYRRSPDEGDFIGSEENKSTGKGTRRREASFSENRG